jgi:hypothetical protein
VQYSASILSARPPVTCFVVIRSRHFSAPTSYTLPNKCVVWPKFSSAPLFKFSTYLCSVAWVSKQRACAPMHVRKQEL